MALIPGGGAVGGHLVTSGLAVPAIPQPMVQPMMGSGSVSAELAAGGAWDMKAWEKDYEGNPDANSCIYVAIGGELHASVWDSKKHRPTNVPLKASCSDEDHDSAAYPPESLTRLPSSGLQAVVAVDEGASIRRMQKWLDSDSRSRAYGTLPFGVRVGADCLKIDSTTLEIRPARTLGLQGKCERYSTDCFDSQQKYGTLSVIPITSESDDTYFSSIEVQLRLQRQGGKCEEEIKEEELVLAPEDLVAFLFAHVRRCCADAHNSGLKSHVAFAVPSWWGCHRRAAISSAASRAGAIPLRMFSAPLCTVIGLRERLQGEIFCGVGSDPALLHLETQESVLEGNPVLVVSEDSDFIDVMLLQTHVPQNNGPTSIDSDCRVLPSWRALSAGAGGLRLGEPESWESILVRAVQQVIRESTSDQSISLIVLVGAVNIEVVLAAIAAETGKHRDLLSCIEVLHAEPGDTADGLSFLMAGELGCEEEARVVMPSATDVCGEAVNASIHPLGTSDALREPDIQSNILIRRGQELPVTSRHTFTQMFGANHSDDLNVSVCTSQCNDRSACMWHQQCSFSSVLTLEGEDGKLYPCESVVLSVTMNTNGILVAELAEISSSMYEKINRKRSQWRWLLTLCLVILIAISVLARWEPSNSPGVKKTFRLRLETFLQLHNPSKLKEVDNWLRKYSGRESSLVDMLEKKYGAQFPKSSSLNKNEHEL